MNDSYFKWFGNRIVTDQFKQFMPSLARTGTVRERGIFIPTGTERRVIRNCVLYSVPDLYRALAPFSDREAKASVLASVDCFNFRCKPEEAEMYGRDTYPFQLFPQITQERYHELLVGYDLLFDLDGFELNRDNFNRALDFLDALERDFGKGNVLLKDSGSKGAHFLVPFKAIKGGEALLPYFPSFARKIASFYKESVGLPELDLSIYGEKRLFRLPLSPHEEKDVISMPLCRADLEAGYDRKENTIEKCLARINTEGMPTWNLSACIPMVCDRVWGLKHEFDEETRTEVG